MKCPKCNSTDIAGLVQSFWASLDESGNELKHDWIEYQSSTELGAERMCADCGYEFEEGDEKGE